MSTKKLSVVLPAFNEAAGLDRLLDRISASLTEAGANYEIIVVDDGSDDGTASIAAHASTRMPIHLIRHSVNMGYGAAMRTGMLAASRRAEFVLTMDADDSHDPALIPSMLDRLEDGYDIVIASRFQPGGREVGVPFHRKLLSHGASRVFKIAVPIAGVRDYTCGYRALRTHVVRRMVAEYGEDHFIEHLGFTCGLELLLKASRNGARIGEVPLVLRYDRKRSASKMQILPTVRTYVGMLLAQGRPGETQNVAAAGLTIARATRSPRAVRRATMLASAAADVTAIAASFFISFIVYVHSINTGILSRSLPEPGGYVLLTGLFAAVCLAMFWQVGAFREQATVMSLRHLQTVTRGLTVAAAVFFAILFFTNWPNPSRVVIVGGIGVSYLLVLLERRLLSDYLKKRRRGRGEGRRVLILGSGATGQLLMKKIMQASQFGAHVVGFLDDEAREGSQVTCRLSQIEESYFQAPVLGGHRDLEDLAPRLGIDELLVADLELDPGRMNRVLELCQDLGVQAGVVAHLGGDRPDQVVVEDISAIPILRPYTSPPRHIYTAVKRMLDVLSASALIVVTSPLWAIAAVLVRASGPGPVFFRQDRVGLHGRRFTIIKFRTMRHDTEPYAHSARSIDDPRITPAGRLLRIAGIDELPQLINVLRGEMSIVGPRPEMPFLVKDYTRMERRRLQVKPGITGLWQLSPDRGQEIHSNIEYDLYYIRHRGLAVDLLILGETFLFVMAAVGSLIARLVSSGRAHIRERAAVRPEVPRTLESDGRYLLLALDQRRRPDEPASWRTVVAPVSSLSARWHVKVVVAERNEPRFEDIMKDAADDGEGTTKSGNGHAPEYVSYREPHQVLELTKEAGVVVTDLPHVAGWALQHRVDLVVLERDTASWHRGGVAPRGLLEDLGTVFPLHVDGLSAAG